MAAGLYDSLRSPAGLYEGPRKQRSTDGRDELEITDASETDPDIRMVEDDEGLGMVISMRKPSLGSLPTPPPSSTTRRLGVLSSPLPPTNHTKASRGVTRSSSPPSAPKTRRRLGSLSSPLPPSPPSTPHSLPTNRCSLRTGSGKVQRGDRVESDVCSVLCEPCVCAHQDGGVWGCA